MTSITNGFSSGNSYINFKPIVVTDDPSGEPSSYRGCSPSPIPQTSEHYLSLTHTDSLFSSIDDFSSLRMNDDGLDNSCLGAISSSTESMRSSSPSSSRFSMRSPSKTSSTPSPLSDYLMNVEEENQENIDPQEDIDQAKAHIWIRAHEKEFQPALKELITKIKRIPFKTFKEELDKSTKDFNQVIQTADKVDYVVLVEPGKSNKWVVELANPSLLIKPECYLQLGEKEARVFCEYLDKLEDLYKKDNTLSFPKNICLFDDGSYSGKQMCDHINAIYHKMKEIGQRIPSVKKPNCYVVIPFMTKQAEESLEAIKAKQKSLFIAAHAPIPTIKEVISPIHVAKLNELFWKKEEDGAASRGSYYFDHKIPNKVSFVEPLVTGSINFSRRKLAELNHISEEKKSQPAKDNKKLTSTLIQLKQKTNNNISAPIKGFTAPYKNNY